MSEREEGYYHVKIDPEAWECGFWNGLRWEIGAISCGDRHLEEIGPRIPQPNEAPPIGTRYRDESGEVVAVVVPTNTTPEMKQAVLDACGSVQAWVDAHAAWPDMLAALPEPE